MAGCSHCGKLAIEGCVGRCPGCFQPCCRDCEVWPENECADEARERELATWTQEDWDAYYDQQDALADADGR